MSVLRPFFGVVQNEIRLVNLPEVFDIARVLVVGVKPLGEHAEHALDGVTIRVLADL